MHVRKLKSGSWNIEAYAGYNPETGKIYKKSFTGKDLRTLKWKAAEWEQTHRHFNGSFISVRAVIEKYLRMRSPTLSPATLSAYHSIFRNLPGWLLDLPSERLTSEYLQRFINNADVSPKTIKNQIAFISAAFKANEMTLPKVHLPRVELPALNIPEAETVRKTLAAAKEENKELWIVIMLAATGPLRAGEISALQLEDIDKNIIHVRHDMVYGADREWHIKAPKTKTSDRYIDMPQELIDAIFEQGFVTHWKPKRIYDTFQRFLKRHDLPIYRFHDLRHFCISALLSQGIDEIYVAERSGHADHASMKRYVHALGLQRKDATRKALAYFDDALSCEKTCEKN